MRILGFFIAVASLGLSGAAAHAVESYPVDLTNQFVSWCSTSQNQPQTVCSCAVNQAQVQIPAASLASFLNADEGNAMVAVSQGAGVTALQIVTSCAASSGGTTGAAVGAAVGAATGMLGGFGK
ncbi:MAG: hypothetical protein COB59_10465 [Rhodospirillaceae bacterium]|nr:MAG: hypothetical protein COB59_10465 [Rhodospirillaceae bacterium]